jgi:hypothetical protein
MEKILFAAHSGWRWVALLATLVAIGYGLWGWLGGRSWTAQGRKIALFATIALDIQLLLGLVLYVVGERWSSIYPATVRFEHPVTMLLALAAVHITSARLKRGTNTGGRYRLLALGTTIALLLIVVAIVRLPGGATRLTSMTPM